MTHDMLGAANLLVPLETDVKMGNNWYETKQEMKEFVAL